MPSRKQRRRREKGLRHEYETVLLDEEGNELPLDPDELRAEREAKQRDRAKSSRGKPAASSGRGSARALREPPPASWRRAVRRGGLMGGVIFVLFVFVLKNGSTTGRAITAAIYAVAFIPMTYWIDRLSYRTYQRRIARQAEKK